MKLPNWCRIGWWVLLTSSLSWLLYQRYPSLIAGNATPVDILFCIVWVALMLAPLFQEFSLLGVKFKQEVDALKSLIVTQVGEIRSEVRNAIDVRTTFNQQFTVPAPVSDAQLPELEARIKAAVSEAFAAQGPAAKGPSASTVSAPKDANFLFAVRYSIEKELRRLVQSRGLMANGRPVPVLRLGKALVEAGLIEPRLENAIREVYAVCSPAIHGEPVTSAQVAFVEDVGPELIAALRSIQ